LNLATVVVPHSIGPYRILQPLGRGGMGVVYHAVHEQTGRRAAVKTVLLPRSSQLRSIRREIHALASLRHPGVVQILDEGLHDGLPWYAMELLEGQSLHRYRESLATPTTGGAAVPFRPALVGSRPDAWDRLSTSHVWWTAALAAATDSASGSEPPQAAAAPSAAQPLPPDALPAVLTLVRHLCKTLAFLHGEGIVHRDLKPDNILIRVASNERATSSVQAASGEQDEPGDAGGSLATRYSRLATSCLPVLVDFGLISRFPGGDGREAFELAGTPVGTVAYMAPEQIRGDLVDARADLYAIGCILYELLTGRRPFDGENSREIRRAHLDVEPRPPSHLAETLPPGLDALILSLLAKRPQDRLGHAQDLELALASFGATELPQARTWPAPQPYLYRPGLAGREAALEALRERLDAAAHGNGAIVMLGGESGAGKTRLAMELGREALRRGFLVLTGECERLGYGASEAPVLAATALRPLRRPLQELVDRCREFGPEEAERVFGGSGGWLSAYEPSIASLPGQEAHSGPPGLPPRAAQQQLYRQLAETFQALAARQKVLLVLEDLHWADELTLGFLEFLLEPRRLETVPLLVLGTYRADETRDDLCALLEHPGCAPLVLPRLADHEVEGMIEQMLALRPVPQRLVRLVARNSGGNPFFVAEWLRSAVAANALWRDQHGLWQIGTSDGLELPRSLHGLILRRLDTVSAASRQLCELAAVAGHELGEALLARLADALQIPEPEASQEAIRRQILEPVPGHKLRFVHDTLREVASAAIGLPRRRELHRLLATVLETQPELGIQDHGAALGHHW
jgi:serine/threonine protein kinase